MPMPGHLTITGEEQGEIEGSCEWLEREGTILVQAFDHVVEIPADDRGIASGRRVHRPMVFTKEIDKSTPMLYQALCTGELLTEMKLKWYRIDGTGEEELYFTMAMFNGMVTKIHPWVPNVLEKKNEHLKHMEDVHISYEKIIWTWEPDGIEYEDAWSGLES
ncbi:MAG: Hcp family type VI secretion system effector [Gammaproteobacteria bacterium]|nr:Hcp family type VI secretion system effector [Gammaproteobacteria bacterium]